MEYFATEIGPDPDLWTWGERNTVSIRHPISLAVPQLSGWLDTTPAKLPGDSLMPRVQSPGFGASERFAVSPGRDRRRLLPHARRPERPPHVAVLSRRPRCVGQRRTDAVPPRRDRDHSLTLVPAGERGSKPQGVHRAQGVALASTCLTWPSLRGSDTAAVDSLRLVRRPRGGISPRRSRRSVDDRVTYASSGPRLDEPENFMLTTSPMGSCPRHRARCGCGLAVPKILQFNENNASEAQGKSDPTLAGQGPPGGADRARRTPRDHRHRPRQRIGRNRVRDLRQDRRHPFRRRRSGGRGALLLKIDDSELVAERQRALYRVELAERAEARQQQLLDDGVISSETYDVALGELNVLRAELQLIDAQLLKTEIRAPFGGVIGLRWVSPGSYLSSQTRIASLHDLDPVKLDFSVPERYSALMRVGDEIAFTVEGFERMFPGTIYAIEPSVDAATRSLRMRARCPNSDGALLPGAFANVELVVRSVADALTVPAIAVIPELGGKKVFVYRGRQGRAAAPSTPASATSARSRSPAASTTAISSSSPASSQLQPGARGRARGTRRAGASSAMTLYTLSIRRPVLAIVMSITIVLFGLLGFSFLGVREFPSLDPPNITRLHRLSRRLGRRHRVPDHRAARGVDQRGRRHPHPDLDQPRRPQHHPGRVRPRDRSRTRRQRRPRRGLPGPVATCRPTSTRRSSPRPTPTRGPSSGSRCAATAATCSSSAGSPTRCSSSGCRPFPTSPASTSGARRPTPCGCGSTRTSSPPTGCRRWTCATRSRGRTSSCRRAASRAPRSSCRCAP